MPGKFHFELVSPEQKLVSQEVAMVTIPGEEGEFGVLAGHAPLLSAMRMGVIAIHEDGMQDRPRRFFVAGGFADVGAAHCTVLAEQATDLSLVDVSALDAEIASLATLADMNDPRAQARLDIARAKRAALQ
jgi:F-type H+-transporting ATPase subunit epsilon